MTQAVHSLGGGSHSSEKLAAAQADLNKFPSANLYDGGCAECACEIPVVLQYEDGDPVPDAEFVIKWGEQTEGEEGEINVTPTTEAQKKAPEIKGVVDKNGLARVKNSPCGSYVILFGEGSDAMAPKSIDENSELHRAIEEATVTAGVDSLTPRGRGQLLWWLSYWMKEIKAENMLRRIKEGDLSSASEVRDFIKENGAPLWTNDKGEVNESKKAAVLKEIESQSVTDMVADNIGWKNDGALDRLAEALEAAREDFDYPDDDNAHKVAKSLQKILTNGSGVPNGRFYHVMQNIKQAQQIASQLYDPKEASGWDVLLLVAEAILGCIPVVGDVIDVVDIMRWLYKFSDEHETPGEWDYIELGALSLGFIPVAGVFLKKTFAPIAQFFASIRGAKKFAGKASDLLQKTIQVLRKIGDGNLIQWLLEKKAIVKEKAQELKGILNNICTSVVAALGKFISNSTIFTVGTSLAKRLLKIFNNFKASINKYIDPFLDKIDDLVASFIAKIANRFTSTATKQIDPTVFKLRRRKADGSGGLAQKGNGERLPDGTCPIGFEKSNPVNMILGQPFHNQVDFSAGLCSLERTWTPNQGGGLFGPCWSTPLSSYIDVGPDGAKFQTAMGRKIPFDVPINGLVCVNIHADDYELIEYGKGFAIRDANHWLWIYEAYDGMVRRLSSVRDSNGMGYDLSYSVDDDAPLGLQPSVLTLTNGEIYDLDVHKGRLRTITHRATGIIEAQYCYGQHGLLTGATNAAGYIQSYGYDSQRRLTTLDYNQEHQTNYEYDERDRAISVSTDTQYYHDRFEYGEPNEDGIRAVNFIDTLGNRTTLHIDSDDQVIALFEANGAVTRYTYNDHGDVTDETTPLGSIIKREWDACGNLLNITHPDGSTETFERDERGRLLSYTDPVGSQWRYERDHKGNVLSEQWPDGQCWRYQLNQRGQATKIHKPDGSELSLVYNTQHRLAQWTDALGATTHFHYNHRGQVILRIEADGSQTAFDYDTAGRLSAATLANGTKLHWQWSARGDLLESTDGEGNSTQRHYGPYGLLEAITNPKGGRIHFQRDPLMRLVSVVNENNEHFRYEYDSVNRVTTETDFSGRQLRYRYDIAGRLSEKTAGDGKVTRYTHNPMGQVLRQEIFEGGEASPPDLTRFSYDPRGLLTKAQNRDATVEFERDVLGRVTKETLNGRVIESHYNAYGELARHNVDGRQTQYHYNAQGLITSLGIGDHTPLQFEHDLMGRERTRRSGTGFSEHRQWDVLGQLTQQLAGREDHLLHQAPSEHWRLPSSNSRYVGAVRTYQYDQAANLTAIDDNRWGATHYQYDDNQQVIAAHYENKRNETDSLLQEHFAYDPARNIHQSEEVHLGRSIDFTQAPPKDRRRAQNQRIPGGRIQRRGDTTYAYDAQGRMISKRVDSSGFRPQQWRYQWDGEDQLRQVTTPDEAIWRYSYDPFGRRIGKRCIQPGKRRHTQAQTVHYLWSGNLLSEEQRIYADGTEQCVAYHYEQNSFRPIAQEVDGKLSYIVTDHLGTPKEMISEEGELQWSARHKLWGSIAQRHKAANDGDYNCLLRFQGQIEDEETGLFYNRFRYYDPESSNYLSSDPIRLAGGIRLHGYVNNSTSWIDPFGLSGYTTNGRANLSPATSGKWGSFEGDELNSDFILSSDGARRTGYPEGTRIPYREGQVDFTDFAKDSYSAKELTGDPSGDRSKMLSALAEKKGMTQAEADQWLRDNNLRMHHHGGDQVLLVDKGLHRVPHTGGAAKLRC